MGFPGLYVLYQVKASVSHRVQVTNFSESHVNITDVFAELACLDAGILGRKITLSAETGSIDAALALLTPEESRKARRKFRKLSRSWARSDWTKMSRRSKRSVVEMEIYYQAIMKLHRLGREPEDNDEV